jgi:cytochrome c biogenesis protein CcmG/thiol:disulfide interchange protein DsbE
MRGPLRAIAVLVLVLLTAAITAAGCSRGGDSQTLSGQAPDFELLATGGNTVRLSDYPGNVILLDFWATWCPPCQEMIPVLSKVHGELGDRGVTVLGVSLDRDGMDSLKPFMETNSIPYTVLLADKKVERAYGGIATIPTLFIIDREGRLVRKLVGYHSYGQIKGELNRYL